MPGRNLGALGHEEATEVVCAFLADGTSVRFGKLKKRWVKQVSQTDQNVGPRDM